MIKIDPLDQKILACLNEDARASYTKIAKRVRSSKEVVNYRIRKLLENGIIKEFVTIFGLGYWAYKMLVKLDNVTPETEKKINGYLISNPYVNWVTPCTGNWDIVFAIMAKDPVHFDKVLRDILGELKDHINDYKVSVSITTQTFGHTYLVGNGKEPTETKKNVIGDMKFDSRDKAIARILHRNARAKITEISSKTRIPVDTVKYRINSMERNSVIRRYRLILDSSKLGYNRYELFIRCINLTDSMLRKFKEYARQKPNIEFFERCIGGWDIELTVHLKTNEEMRGLLLDLKSKFGDSIKSIESVALFETHNYVYLPEELR